jgi:hypothetical protein
MNPAVIAVCFATASVILAAGTLRQIMCPAAAHPLP